MCQPFFVDLSSIIFYNIYMIKINIEELLKKENKTKYWLCNQMNMTSRNLNRIINGKTTAISFKYIEEFCKHLNCTPEDLISIENDEN